MKKKKQVEKISHLSSINFKNVTQIKFMVLTSTTKMFFLVINCGLYIIFQC